MIFLVYPFSRQDLGHFNFQVILSIKFKKQFFGQKEKKKEQFVAVWIEQKPSQNLELNLLRLCKLNHWIKISEEYSSTMFLLNRMSLLVFVDFHRKWRVIYTIHQWIEIGKCLSINSHATSSNHSPFPFRTFILTNIVFVASLVVRECEVPVAHAIYSAPLAANHITVGVLQTSGVFVSTHAQ